MSQLNEEGMKIEVRRMEGAPWVRLDRGLAVVPIRLVEEFRERWTEPIASAVERKEAIVNVGLDGGRDGT